MDEHELQYNDLYKHSLSSGGLYHFVMCILIMILVFDPSPLLIQHQPSHKEEPYLHTMAPQHLQLWRQLLYQENLASQDLAWMVITG